MNGTNALRLLKEGHARAKLLLEELDETSERSADKRRKLLLAIGVELRVHARLEEEMLYPALKRAAASSAQRRVVTEALEEHRVVEKMVLPDLEATDPSTAEFGGRAKVLKELVLHHSDEEEDELFELSKELLSDEALDELGARMARRQDALEKRFEAA